MYRRRSTYAQLVDRLRSDPCPPPQTNGYRRAVNLPPVSEAPAAAVRAAWEPLRAGQTIPLLGEVTTDDCLPCECD